MTDKLYKITERFLACLWRLEEFGGEVDDQLEKDMEACEADLSVKVDRCLTIAVDYRAKAAACKERADKMKAHATRLKNRAAWLENYVLRNIRAVEKDTLETENYPAISVRQNPPKVVVDESLFWTLGDGKYVKQADPVPDKAAIKEALKAGSDVPGCGLERGWRLVY